MAYAVTTAAQLQALLNRFTDHGNLSVRNGKANGNNGNSSGSSRVETDDDSVLPEKSLAP